MNANLELPQMSNNSAPATNAPTANVHIVLATNHDFGEALQHVMRIAEMSNVGPTTPPLRVEIEIQTPPGAIVKVYVSRQADSYRAQLGTDNPQALAWVKDQVASLRQNTDSGVAVRWLPPQVETASSSSSTGDRGMTWDRGGQNQQSGESPDERRQSPRQKRPSLPDFASETLVLAPLLAGRSA